MRIGDAAVIDPRGLDALIRILGALGYDTMGPVVQDGAIKPGPVAGVVDLPVGYRDEQAPGHYRLTKGDDELVFSWAVGPGSWKAELFPPTQELWRARVDGDEVTFVQPEPPTAPMAVIGARPCELASLDVLDRVMRNNEIADPRYAARRDGAFVVVAECGVPAATCFCTSMGTGPGAEKGFDLALSEIDKGGQHFVVRVGTERGAEVLSLLATASATSEDLEDRRSMLAAAATSIQRRLDTEGLPGLLARNLEHPRWDEVAERCLACGNCTLVCPTCFCSTVFDSTDLDGSVARAGPGPRVSNWLTPTSTPVQCAYATVALSPMDESQALNLVGPVRDLGLCRLRSLHCVVPGRDRHHPRSGGDPGQRWCRSTRSGAVRGACSATQSRRGSARRGRDVTV